MAKLSTIFSTASGSVGNVTMRSVKTATNTRAIVASSKVTSETQTNPRTTSQMTQRAKFATAVKFYKRATQNFFKFAFEDKKANESDYNAFMRHNVSAALPMNKYQVNAPAFPALANRWQLADGSLPQVVITKGTNYNASLFVFPGLNPQEEDKVLNGDEAETVGSLSNVLLRAGFAEGDIVTFVAVGSDLEGDDILNTSEDAVNEVSANASVPKWFIAQFVINSADITLLSEIPYIGQNWGEDIAFKLDFDSSVAYSSFINSDDSRICGISVIVTRHKDKSRDLYASPAWLVGTDGFDAAVANVGSESYVTNMLLSWGADTSTAILAGSVAGETSTVDPYNGYPSISTVNGSAVPATISRVGQGDNTVLTIRGTNLTSEHELTENSFTFEGDAAGKCSVVSFVVNSSTQATLTVTNTYEGSGSSVSVVAAVPTESGTLQQTIATLQLVGSLA